MKAVVEYQGGAYAGFQRQPTFPSIQSSLERAIEAATGRGSAVSAAGRTDSGAHAAGQVISFCTNSRLDDHVLLRATNAHLPPDIALQTLETTDDSFDPRRAAVSREYHYLVLNRPVPSPLWNGRAHRVGTPVDVAVMQSAANHFVGIHDFSSFASPASDDESPVREIYELDAKRNGELITFRIVGSGFMKHMIRTIIGTLLTVGTGRLQPDEVVGILLSRERIRSAPPVPACGLYLMKVNYEACSS